MCDVSEDDDDNDDDKCAGDDTVDISSDMTNDITFFSDVNSALLLFNMRDMFTVFLYSSFNLTSSPWMKWAMARVSSSLIPNAVHKTR